MIRVRKLHSVFTTDAGMASLLIIYVLPHFVELNNPLEP